MNTAIKWDDFWPMLNGMSPETLVDCAEQLCLAEWLPTRSPIVAFEVLREAPRSVVNHFLPTLPVVTHNRLVKQHGLPLPARLLIADEVEPCQQR